MRMSANIYSFYLYIKQNSILSNLISVKNNLKNTLIFTICTKIPINSDFLTVFYFFNRRKKSKITNKNAKTSDFYIEKAIYVEFPTVCAKNIDILRIRD